MVSAIKHTADFPQENQLNKDAKTLAINKASINYTRC